VLIIRPEIEDIAQGLESWDWIDFKGLTPIVASSFGDIFFDSGSEILFLDTLGGQLKSVCGTKAELQEILNTPEGQDEYLLAGLVEALHRSGLQLEPGQCYDFTISPALGGLIEPSNVKVMSLKVSLNCAGQIHKQVKDLPVGTVISEVKLADS